MKLNLNSKQMPFLPYKQRKEIPSKPGIYYVGNNHCPVMYVGLSRKLKQRHMNHHRQVQFENFENPVIRYRILPENMLNRISDLGHTLKGLENQAKDYYKPPLNDTPVPNQTKIQTSHGPVYIQIHKVREAGYCLHFNSQDGDELAINTSKLPMVTRAIQDKRPIFLIASGYYKDYEIENYPFLNELAPFKNDKIYLLISRFIPYEYEYSDVLCYNYTVYGGNSKVFIQPYIILNNQPGFQEFKRKYLRLGFTNCERSEFAKQLLQLGDFN
ncbi:MAG: hypothetical protein QNJ36_16260 [Calothrix sp. MO_167.B42]|nr:hypothetical protein [Calothrix sp. MO_167.B42]